MLSSCALGLLELMMLQNAQMHQLLLGRLAAEAVDPGPTAQVRGRRAGGGAPRLPLQVPLWGFLWGRRQRNRKPAHTYLAGYVWHLLLPCPMSASLGWGWGSPNPDHSGLVSRLPCSASPTGLQAQDGGHYRTLGLQGA